MSAATAVAAPSELSKPHPSHPLLQPGQQITRDVLVGGVPTALILTSFSDRIFIAVTQLNKLGSFTLAATSHLNAAAPDDAPSYSVTTLLGPRHAPMPQLLARRLIESISCSAHEHMAGKSLLLSLALRKKPSGDGGMGSGSSATRDEEMQIVRDIVAEVDKIKVW